jgi:hypothetical protein
MEKVWFRYNFGFVNIDEKNIYFTNTGNWSDTISLRESTRNAKRADVLTKGSVIFYLAAVYIIGFVIFLLNVSSSSFSIVVFVGLPFATWYVYKYFQRDLGRRFLIPVEKIKKVSIEDDKVKLIFTNGNSEEEEFEIEKVEEKGLRIFEEIFRPKASFLKHIET